MTKLINGLNSFVNSLREEKNIIKTPKALIKNSFSNENTFELFNV